MLLKLRLSIGSLVCIQKVLTLIALNFIHTVYLLEFYDSNNNNNNNNNYYYYYYYYLLQLGCYPVVVVILHVNKI